MKLDNKNNTFLENSTKSDFSILDLARNLVRSSSQKKTDDKNLIILGEKSSGKTNIFNSLLQIASKDNYTPSCGLNYGYMKFQTSVGKKAILNVYEIGGGIQNINLIRTVINENNIKNTVFILTLDLSNTQSILKSLINYLKELKLLLKELFSQDLLLELIENKKFKYNDIISKDFKMIDVLPAEMIVVGTKYDYLEKIDLEKIKWTCRTLRFFCHLNSLSLVYFKTRDIKLTKTLTNLVMNISFENNRNESIFNFLQKNDILPLFVLYSKDSLIDIGDPRIINFKKDNKGDSKPDNDTYDLSSMWEDTFHSIFSLDCKNDNEDYQNFEIIEEELKEKYKEPRIDEEVQNFE